MPIPAVPTLLLAIGGIWLIMGRWVSSSRWCDWSWIVAQLVVATAMLMEQHPPDSDSVGHLADEVWLVDSLASATQWYAWTLGLLLGIGCLGSRSSRDRSMERHGFLSIQMAGVMLIGASNDLIALALAAEVVQFASWALRKIDRLERQCADDDVRASQPDIDFSVWIGVTTSCCLWLGIALLANVTASTQFDQIRHLLSSVYIPNSGRVVIGSGSKLGLLAIGLITAGFGSRLGLFPWQIGFLENARDTSYWTAGCTILAGQLSGIVALSRLCGAVYVGYRDDISVLLLVLSGLTCVVSAALSGLGLMHGEGRLRRWVVSIPMLHSAWLTIGLLAANADAAAPEMGLAAVEGQPSSLAILFFAVAASQVGLAGLYLLLSYLSRETREVEFVDELLGLWRLHPLPAASLLVILASLIGQPPLWGFWSNWLIMVAGLNVRVSDGRENTMPHVGIIVVIAALTIATLMTAGVVIRFARTILLEQPISTIEPHGRRSALFMGSICAAVLLLVGLFPARFLVAVSTVRGIELKTTPDGPAGKHRGSATASLP